MVSRCASDRRVDSRTRQVDRPRTGAVAAMGKDAPEPGGGSTSTKPQSRSMTCSCQAEKRSTNPRQIAGGIGLPAYGRVLWQMM